VDASLPHEPAYYRERIARRAAMEDLADLAQARRRYGDISPELRKLVERAEPDTLYPSPPKIGR
jgi:hypothetical protein